MLGPPSTLITAKHVLKKPLAAGHEYAVAYASKDGPTIGVLARRHVRFSQKWDIAALPRVEAPGLDMFALQLEKLPLTDDVVSFDYSATRFEVKDGRHQAFLEPLTHKGNLMRDYISDAPGWEGTPAWDTSFPALQGASGAPVMAMRGGGIVGMLVANVERHLVPAQVLRANLGGTDIEEVRYFLPIGFAVRAIVIGEFLAEIGIDVNTVMNDAAERDSY